MSARKVTAEILEKGRYLTSRVRGAAWASLSHSEGISLRVDQGTRIRNAHKVRFGRNCWLKENVILDGRSDLSLGIDFADGVIIRAGTYIDSYGGQGFVRLGKNVGIGQHVYIGGNGGVLIEDDVMVSGHCYIVAATHNLDPNSSAPYRAQGESRRGIVIRQNAWVAAGSVVMDGVEIGTNAVVGAGSVVTRSVPPNVVVAGTPARVVRGVSDTPWRLREVEVTDASDARSEEG
ncbi:acyltransferase [Streptomyces sp. bgisy034]|uniref:acyltransferase n=1 Tax=Streptomyces sp. bgisy034 TaxID=3413774 RepID=UPI003EBF59C9